MFLLRVRCWEMVEQLGSHQGLAPALTPLSSQRSCHAQLRLTVAKWLLLLQHLIHSQDRRKGRGKPFYLFSQCVCGISRRISIYVSWTGRVRGGESQRGHVTPKQGRAAVLRRQLRVWLPSTWEILIFRSKTPRP